MKIAYRANVVTKEKVLTDSFVATENGMIVYVGKDSPENCEIIDYSGKYIFPGFIDIHCHASAKNMAFEDTKEVALYHRAHGTTSMLLTFYRDVPHEKLIECLKITSRSCVFLVFSSGYWLVDQNSLLFFR